MECDSNYVLQLGVAWELIVGKLMMHVREYLAQDREQPLLYIFVHVTQVHAATHDHQWKLLTFCDLHNYATQHHVM